MLALNVSVWHSTARMFGFWITVIKMAMFTCVELDVPVAVEARGNEAIRCKPLDDRKIAIGDAQRLVRGRELDAIACGERLRDFPINVHAGEPPRIIFG
jgi:hypothetical protein